MPWGRTGAPGLGQPLGLLLGRTACRGVRAGPGLLTVCCFGSAASHLSVSLQVESEAVLPGAGSVGFCPLGF